MLSIKRMLACIALFCLPAVAAGQGLDASRLDQVFDRSGQRLGDVYKLGFPRTDLHVTVHGIAIKPGLALGSWAAFAGTDNDAMVMGDLVRLENEVNPVMRQLRQSGFEVTALHNHLIDETPRVMYMHYMAHGHAAELASVVSNK